MDLLSKEYKEQLEQLHTKKKTFGRNTNQNANDVVDYLIKYNPTSIIDYGCGKGELLPILQRHCIFADVQGYDPAIPEYSTLPDKKFDMLVSTDVLEHIEPDYLDNVLQHINATFTKVAYLIIACGPAKKTLPDGRNAHLIQEGLDWWKPRLEKHIDGQIVETVYTDRTYFHDKKQTYLNKKEIKVIIKK